ncbi:6,7-dimethyl-8-ribityllumazine synthase [Acidimangrovimonas sediminis]|uniref:6,7-dimethyl-8-ribityllumazine synthase n=1 Tax=Acidimangrovimonas sediminis TaxID=2056283 RepID=UPI000C80AB90|nr:6,7-dimethyl-8-ribityllumazine synthase [Acidimangrovimonas sediminis]
MASSETHHTLPKPVFDTPVKLLIVVAPYYKDIADQLVAGARAAIEAVGGTHETIEVPGALEVPQAIALAARLSNYDGYVALGCVIRGETTHYETVCNDSSHALMLLGLQGACVGNGILTVEHHAQAAVRAEAKGQNKGGGAADAALHLIALARRWSGTSRPVGFQPGGEFQVAGQGMTGKDQA